MNKNEIKDSFINTWQCEANEILRLHEYIDFDIMEAITEKIALCDGKIVITGCGTSAAAAKKIVHSFTVIDIPSVFLIPSDAVHGSLGVVTEKDIVIFVSKGGNTEELTSFVQNVKNKGAFIITVSENEESLLAQNADLFLKVKIEREPDPFDMLASASTLAIISVFDAICIALMDRPGFDKDRFYLNHPKGAVGKRLSENK